MTTEVENPSLAPPRTRRQRENAILEYVRAHVSSLQDRSAEVVARRLEMDEVDLSALVHESERLRMRWCAPFWHVVEEQ